MERGPLRATAIEAKKSVIVETILLYQKYIKFLEHSIIGQGLYITTVSICLVPKRVIHYYYEKRYIIMDMYSNTLTNNKLTNQSLVTTYDILKSTTRNKNRILISAQACIANLKKLSTFPNDRLHSMVEAYTVW